VTLKEYIASTEGQSYTQRALGWFLHNLNQIVTSEELAQIPGQKGNPISHNIRRIFELRDEKGYELVNHKDNESQGLNLKVNEWMLLSSKPNPRNIRSRGVNKRIMFEVFERDMYTCKICGRTAEDDDPFKSGHKIKLHVGHINPHKNDEREDNSKVLTKKDFITMCNVCNEGLKNKELKSFTLLDKVKDSTKEEKEEILNYLTKVNPNHLD